MSLKLPCFLLFLLGLFIWLNFHPASAGAMLLYWPALLIAISAFALFVPAPVLYHRSREWWAYSNVSHLGKIKMNHKLI